MPYSYGGMANLRWDKSAKNKAQMKRKKQWFHLDMEFNAWNNFIKKTIAFYFQKNQGKNKNLFDFFL